MRIVLILALFLVSCQTPTPKPMAQFALEYPNPEYTIFEGTCPYQFEYNTQANTQMLSACGVTLSYPKLKAKLYLTYFDLSKNSLDTLLMDFDKRIKMFGKEAALVDESSFENNAQKVLGSCITLIGNTPSNLHFFGTDAQKHYLTGSLLFETSPHYDSLAPAINYVKSDVQNLLETLRWN